MSLLRLYRLHFIAYIVLFAALFGVLILELSDIVDHPVSDILNWSIFILLIADTLIPMVRYMNSLDRVNTDIEGFLAEQGRFSKRTRGKMRFTIDNNIAVGLIRYERYDEAEALLRYVQPVVVKCPERYRFVWLNNYMSVMIAKRNFTEAYNILAEMEKLFPAIKTMGKKDYAVMRSIIDGARTDILFYQLTEEQLRTTHRDVCQAFYDHCVAAANRADRGAMRESSLTSLKFKAASCLVFLGREGEAKPIFEEIAALDYTFPVVGRTRDYLQTGDTSLLLRTAE